MTNKTHYLILLCLVIGIHQVDAQQFLTAGPDKITCEGRGVQIGPPDFNPELCYRWEPSTGLSCTDCPNPEASPEEDTEYTLHIADDDFSTSFSDAVEVTLDFGYLTFDAQYLRQGSEETATATLERHDGSEIEWDFEGDDLGCEIDPATPNSAIISPGNKFGKLTVTATKMNDGECVARATIEINAGVKDIEVLDLMSEPGSVRKAKQGETLHIIGDPNIKITAIPNDGEVFMPPQTPNWHAPYANSLNIQDGQIERLYEVPTNGSGAFTAGYGAPDFEPTTYVDLHAPVTEEISIQSFIDLINTYITDPVKTKAKFGPPAPSLTVDLVIADTKLKITPVEKYNSPELEDKHDFDLSCGLTITGTIYHPALTKTIAFPAALGGDTLAMSEVSLAGIGSFSIVGGFVSDPSKADDSWQLKSQLVSTATLAVKATVGGSFDFGGYTLKGSTSAQASVSTSFTWDAANPNVLTMKTTINPLNMLIELYLQYNLDPREKLYLIRPQNYELIPKYETAPYHMSLGGLF